MKTTTTKRTPGPRLSGFRPTIFIATMIVLATIILLRPQPKAQAGLPLDIPPSLKLIPVPEPPNLGDFVRDRQAAIALGKALFWDMQLGSDGIQACASCHFHAGADGRVKNQMNPGLPGGDATFETGGPNSILTAADFPFHQRSLPADQQESPVSRDTRDVVASQGVRHTQFVDLGVGAEDVINPLTDTVFNVGGIFTNTVRRTTGRNAPSVINAAFNYANFWDGRANNVFNGVNPFGASDLDSKVFVNSGGLQAVLVRIPNAGLASQAVGPPLNDVEMSGSGRTFPKLGKKMLGLRPLAKQIVEASDSVLGPLSRPGDTGLSVSYDGLIRTAFLPQYWDNTSQIVQFAGGGPTISPRPGGALDTSQFTQMEANFSLFFGLSIQLYESTLVADDTLFDRVREGRATFTAVQQKGFDTFFGLGLCQACHGGPEFTNASVTSAAFGLGVLGVVEPMVLGNGQVGIYDVGFYNIGAVRTDDDRGRGGSDPFGFPLSFSILGQRKAQGLLPAAVARYVPDLPPAANGISRTAVDGAFKTPGLRNVELTGPYFHNGGVATLDQVVEFYSRGGNFPVANQANLDVGIVEIPFLQGHPERQAELVAFLLTLTDERVRNESAPFDHPQLLVPDGADDIFPSQDLMVNLPAVGFAGRAVQGLPPLQSFLPAPNRPPVTVEDVVVIPDNSTSAIDVLFNDGDPDGNLISVVEVTQGTNGTTSIGPAGADVTYVPTIGFSGADAFTYTISDGVLTATNTVAVIVQTGNIPPSASLDTVIVLANTATNALDVLANDDDPNANPIRVIAVTAAAHGSASVGPLGAMVIYAPSPGYAGLDTFTYTISDGALTSSASVTVIVNRPPQAFNDTFAVGSNSAGHVLRVLANDVDPDGNALKILAISAPFNGRAVIGPNQDEVLYTPDFNFVGTDRVSYVASDLGALEGADPGQSISIGTAFITVAGNRGPLAVGDAVVVPRDSVNNQISLLANDSDPDADPLFVTSVTQGASGLTIIGGLGLNVFYTPHAGFAGTDAFTYTVSDGDLTSTASVTVTVRLPNPIYFPLVAR